ncbi:alpha-L-rhamnosidase-related protein [Aeoliella mucimassa]|nr:alpha-L-rhamnosidase N-terminal domain-containing protein [Aeoliella mucimassa]
MNRLSLALGCVAFWNLFSAATLADLNDPSSSTASWISTGALGGENQWYAYRKTIDLTASPESAILDIATDSKYWLWINGEMVVYEGGLKRGPTPNDTYFDRVDVTPYLQEGENTVALLNWYYGRGGYSHISSGSPGVLVDGVIDGESLVTDNTWLSTKVDSYGTAGTWWILPEASLQYDERASMGDWQAPEFDDSKWKASTVLGAPGDDPWNDLVERPIPQWKDFGQQAFNNSAFVSTGEEMVFDLPYQAQFTPYFKIAVPSNAAGQTVHMQTETNLLSHTSAEYITATGVHEYESYGWISGEQLHIQFPAGVNVLEVGYRETGYNTEFVDYFQSDDTRINTLMDKGARTQYLNMRDNYFDTPDRERAAWWGDIVNELGQSVYMFDTNSHDLIKKSVWNLADWSNDNGTLHSPIPTDRNTSELPMQMLASVGHYGFANYYRHTNDTETITHVYPKVSNYVLGVWDMRSNGLLDTSRIGNQAGMWDWFDWGDNIDREAIANCWYYLALQGQREQAIAIGDTSDLAEIDQRMESIANNYDSTFWNDSRQAYFSSRHASNGGTPDDRAQALAVLAGLAPESRYDALREVLVKQEKSSPFMEAYVAPALAEMGFAADGLLRLRRRYADQIDSSQSTLGEIFQAGFDANWTKNHAWNAPLTFFAEYVAGIKPIEAGYDTYQVRPNFAGLNAASQHIETIKGGLDFSMSRTDVAGPTAGYQLSLHSPDNTLANVSLPLDGIRAFDQVHVNGQVVYSNGTSSDLPGFTFTGIQNGRLEFEAAPGDWDITVVGQQAGYFTTRSWQTDSDLPLDGSKTYTHAIDFSPGGVANQTLSGTTTIGGVPFTQESVGNGTTTGLGVVSGRDNTSGANWALSGIEFTYQGLGSRAPGEAGGMLSDGLVAGGMNQVLTLNDLEPNTDYILTWFSPLWNGNTDRVGILDGSDDGIGQGMTIAVVQDADAEMLITQYRYNTGDSTTFQMHFTSLTAGETLHHYAFTNELATELFAFVSIVGDANGDGLVDLADFDVISDHFLTSVDPGSHGDVNSDGVVNTKDYRLWQQAYTESLSSFGQGAARVPEPTSLLLLCVALGLVSYRRIKSTAA